MGAREPLVVALAVRGDVLSVLLSELLDGGDDVLLKAVVLLAHRLGAKVGVASRAVPVTRNWLGLERDDGVVRLADAVEDVARHHQVVARLDARAGSDLVLPLTWHDLSVDAANFDASVQARLEVRFHDLAAERNVGARRAVVGSLRSGVSDLDDGSSERARGGLGPSEGMAILEERVLLLDAVPRDEVEVLVEDLLGLDAAVRRDRFALGRVAVAEHKDVLAAAEWIAKDCCGLDDDLRVVARSLASGRSVKVPVGERRWAKGHRSGAHLGL